MSPLANQTVQESSLALIELAAILDVLAAHMVAIKEPGVGNAIAGCGRTAERIAKDLEAVTN